MVSVIEVGVPYPCGSMQQSYAAGCRAAASSSRRSHSMGFADCTWLSLRKSLGSRCASHAFQVHCNTPALTAMKAHLPLTDLSLSLQIETTAGSNYHRNVQQHEVTAACMRYALTSQAAHCEYRAYSLGEAHEDDVPAPDGWQPIRQVGYAP